jgi:hypothetical protein
MGWLNLANNMGKRIALYQQDRPATKGMMPFFNMTPAWIFPQVNSIKPIILIFIGQLWIGNAAIFEIGKFIMVTKTAYRAF